MKVRWIGISIVSVGLLLGRAEAADPVESFFESAVDLTGKVKLGADALAKQYLVEGNKVFFVKKGKRRRLDTPSSPRGSTKRVREQRFEILAKLTESTADDDSPDEPEIGLEHVPVPKKVRAFKQYYDPRGEQPSAKRPKDSVSHKDRQSGISDQGDRGTCTAFATAAGIESMMHGAEKVSAEYLYWLFKGRSIKKVCEDTGSSSEVIAKTLRKNGVPNDANYTYSGYFCPSGDPTQATIDRATIKPQHVYYFEPQLPTVAYAKNKEGKHYFTVMIRSRTVLRSVFFDTLSDAQAAFARLLERTTPGESEGSWYLPKNEDRTCKKGDPAPCRASDAGMTYNAILDDSDKLVAFGELGRPKAKNAPTDGRWSLPEIKSSESKLRSAAIDDPKFLEAVLDAGYDVIAGFDVVWGDDFGDGEIADVPVDAATDRAVVGTGESCKEAKDCSSPGGVAQTCLENACVLSGHQMLIVGYERTKTKKHGGGYFVVKNSWGADGSDGGYGKLTYDYIRHYLRNGVVLTGGVKVPDGGRCNDHAQCENFAALGKEGAACCKSGASAVGTCTQTKRDWAGVWYCPAECVGAAGGKPGSCIDLVSDGDSCKEHKDCEEWAGAGAPGSACCQGKCTAMQPDHAGVYYCPQDCVGKPGGAKGTCSDTESVGATCKEHNDCAGWKGAGKKGVGCCGGSCTWLKQDWAGVYYCPNECRGAAGASLGTCPRRGKNKSCKVSADCKGGRTCCDGKCKSKKKDWAGVYYCPDECVGSPGGKRGTCN